MTEATSAKIPDHLRRYIVEQNYSRYTAEDQATWRYIMRQLKSYLSVHAHESYVEGLKKTGITVDRIPSIEDIDAHLGSIGWGAVPVSGFIPPAAFMEFQSLGILPIASDMRTIDHLLYTPAPDIVHEAAGHAPILANADYSEYLRKYGEVARHSILSKEDIDQYEAIRVLSDIKEDPRSTPAEIKQAENRLNEINQSMTYVSEAALLGRMNWWTAEYGLIGDVRSPRIFGAGLLSSVGESRACMHPRVAKIPLSVDCVNFPYDITEQQPQLFVARDFAHLSEVLEQLAQRLSYRRGGKYGLECAKDARTVNTVEMDSGVQMSGVLSDFLVDDNGQPIYIQFSGPSQLALKYSEMPNQGPKRHPQGFSSPVGLLPKVDLVRDQRTDIKFASGVRVAGVLKSWHKEQGHLVLMTFSDCRVTLGDRVLFDPAWGEYDMAIGSEITSVFGGPADRTHFGETEDFVAKRIPARIFTKDELERHALYKSIRELRDSKTTSRDVLLKTIQRYEQVDGALWLPRLELFELGMKHGLSETELEPLRERLSLDNECARDGLAIAGKIL